MYITREMDYAVRIVRALAGGGQLSAQEIAQAEHMQLSVTYKLLKRMVKTGLVVSRRGATGGYLLGGSLEKLTLYDVFEALDSQERLTDCLTAGYTCENNENGCCCVHREYARVQNCLETELRRFSLGEILSGQAQKCTATVGDTV